MNIVGTKNDIIKKILELENKYYVCDIREPKTKRSLEQNKMLWKLIDLIAKKTHNDEIDVYCSILERANAKSDYIITATDIEKTLKKSFRGVKFIRMQEVNGKDCYVYKVYIGSSKMDTKEMQRLLDVTIQICSEHEIKKKKKHTTI